MALSYLFSGIIMAFSVRKFRILQKLLTFPPDLGIINVDIYIVRCFTLQENIARETAPCDAQLISRYQNGDETAFELLQARYLGLISSIAKKYRGRDLYPDTTDLTQEAMVAMLAAVRKYDSSKNMSFKNFLAMCVETRFISVFREASKKSRIPDNNKIFLDEEGDQISDSNQITVDELLESREHTRALYKRLKEELSPYEYEVTLRYLKGFSCRETAELLGVSEKSVENALSRTRKKISKHR